MKYVKMLFKWNVHQIIIIDLCWMRKGLTIERLEIFAKVIFIPSNPHIAQFYNEPYSCKVNANCFATLHKRSWPSLFRRTFPVGKHEAWVEIQLGNVNKKSICQANTSIESNFDDLEYYYCWMFNYFHHFYLFFFSKLREIFNKQMKCLLLSTNILNHVSKE